MKKTIIASLIILLLLTNLYSAQTKNIETKKIVVDTPVLLNIENENNWIASFVQGQMTTDFQNYSDLSVIDRMAVEALLKEQMLAESSSFIMNESEQENIEYASLVHADYLVKVEIAKTGTSYAIRCSVQDVNTSLSLSGVAHASTGIIESQLMNGSSIHKASYDLLLGLGTPKERIEELLTSAKENSMEITANLNIAKGIQSENNGNIVEAFAYYQKAVDVNSNIKEGLERLDGLTAVLSGGDVLKESVMNEIELRKKWMKIWDDLNDYITHNIYLMYYAPELLKVDKIDYEKELVQLSFPMVVMENLECQKLYDRIWAIYKQVPKQGEWGLASAFPYKRWGFENRIDPEKSRQPALFNVELYNSEGLCIGNARVNLANYFIDTSITVRFVNVKLSDITDNLQICFPESLPGAAYLRTVSGKMLSATSVHTDNF